MDNVEICKQALVEAQEVKNLLEILNDDYFSLLKRYIDENNEELLMKIGMSDTIDYLKEKNRYETLLVCSIEKLRNVVFLQYKLLEDCYKDSKGGGTVGNI